MKRTFLLEIGLFIVVLSGLPLAAAAQTVKLYPSTIRIEKGKTKTITAAAYNAAHDPQYNETFSFTVTNPTIATTTTVLMSDGDVNLPVPSPPNLRTVTGSLAGSTTITATWQGHTSNAATIIVDDPASQPIPVIHGDNDETGSINVKAGEAIEINADASTGVAKSEWTWGDGDKTTDLLSATHAYLAAGSYTVTLKITNSAGQFSTSTVTVNVTEHVACTGANAIHVTDLSDLVIKYNALPIAGGKCLLLDPATYVGNVILPARSFADFVTIASSAAMPNIYNRVSFDQAGLVTIQSSSPVGDESALTIKNGASKLRFVGIKFDAHAPSNPDQDSNSNGYIIQIGEAFNAPTSVSQNPAKIIFEHCVINPREDVKVPHGVINDGYKVSMISSWFGNVKTTGARDSQAVYSLNGRGAHVYNNTYLEAASENIMYGGAVPSIDGIVSTNIEFRRCHFFKRLSWRPTDLNINEKNLFEIKNARRVYVEGSVFENHWNAPGRYQYFAIGIKSTPSPGVPGQFVPWAISEDVVFENDKISHMNGGLVTAVDNYDLLSFRGLKPGNIRLKNLLFDDISAARWGLTGTGDFYSRFLQPADVEDLNLDHVTMIDKDQTAGMAIWFISNNNFRFSVKNSIFGLKSPGIHGDGVASGYASLNFGVDGMGIGGDECGPRPGHTWTVARNVMPIYGGSFLCYPTDNFYPPNYNAIGFTDLAGGNYELSAASSYNNAGTDGRDPGADIPLLNQRTNCTVTGQSQPCLTILPPGLQSPYPGLSAPAIPTVLEVENYDNGGEGVSFHETDTESTPSPRGGAVDVRLRDNIASNDYEVFQAGAGEWLEYTVNVPYTRKFDIGVRYASAVDNGKFRIDDCGPDPNNNNCTDITGLLTAAHTSTNGTWDTFRVVTKRGVQLSAGNHTLRLVMVENSPDVPCHCVVADFDSILFKPALFDYDGDGKADVSVFRPSNGTWYLSRSTDGGLTAINFGLQTDTIAPADFDGDGKADVAVFRPSSGFWYILNSGNNSVTSAQFGTSGDVPVQADYDNDGKADIAVWRSSNATWHRINSLDGSYTGLQFGLSGDLPAVGDYDGDGKSDPAVFRPSSGVWYMLRSTLGSTSASFGSTGDKVTPADYDGDGKTDIAVFRPSNNTWYRINSGDGQFTGVQFGVSGDMPAPADYDGDGKVDISVFRPSTGAWYAIETTEGSSGQIFGVNFDQPTPGTYVH